MKKKLFTVKLHKIKKDKAIVSITGFGEIVMGAGDTVDVVKTYK